MNFLEKDLEQIIMEASDEQLQERGLDEMRGRRFQQLRIGNYGIADIVTVERSSEPNWNETRMIPYLHINVYELKKNKIGISAFLQALGYAKGISRYLDARNFKHRIKYTITLIGSNLDLESTYCFLSDFDLGDRFSLYNYTYSYDIDGINFTYRSDTSRTVEGFNLENL